MPLKVAIYMVTILCACSFASSREPRKPDRNTVDTTEARMVVHLSSKGTDKGISLVYPAELSSTSARPVKFPFRVVNLLEEELFLEVTEHDDLSFELGENGHWAFGGGSAIGFPDNASLLKRLHACECKDGKARPCGCAMAFITAKIDFGEEISLNNWIGEKAIITVVLKGYYRANGKEFEKTVKLPVKIVK